MFHVFIVVISHIKYFLPKSWDGPLWWAFIWWRETLYLLICLTLSRRLCLYDFMWSQKAPQILFRKCYYKTLCDVFWKADFLWLTESSGWFCCHFVQKVSGVQVGTGAVIYNVIIKYGATEDELRKITLNSYKTKWRQSKKRIEGRRGDSVVNSTGRSPTERVQFPVPV